MLSLAKEINELLKSDSKVKEYLALKKDVENDTKLEELRTKLDLLRKDICKNKKYENEEEYYKLLQEYKNDKKIIRLEFLQKELYDFFKEISDILNLK